MPSFLTPDVGLLFWMLIAFLVVFVLLAKFGFPVIVDMVDKRKQYIDESLIAARQSNEKLASIKQECQTLLQEAHARQSEILKEAATIRDQIVDDAKAKAQEEASRILEDAQLQVHSEIERAQRNMRTMVADLSIQIAEKVLSRELQKDDKQSQWIDQLLDSLSEKTK